MFDRSYFSHEDPITNKIEMWNISKCYDYEYAGENLSKGFIETKSIHKALMNSPTYKVNIVNVNFNRVGIGCYEDICTQAFGN